ncbi:MAG: zf-HC2 domain-containing protein [candidate division WOR-3 bacterium]
MKCDREKIFNYLSDLLPEEEKRIIKEHLISCPICQQYQKEFLLIKEELTQKESPPDFSFFYEKLQERIKKRRKRLIILVPTFATFFILIFFLFLLILKEKRTEIEEYVLEEDYETIISNLSSQEGEVILKDLSKEIKEEDLILLEERLVEEKEYYDLIFNLENEELEYLIKNLNKKGGQNERKKYQENFFNSSFISFCSLLFSTLSL